MALQEKQLGQLRPLDTNAASIYSPNLGVTGIPKVIVICNTTNTSAKASLFQDDDGTTFDKTTALLFEVPVTKGQSVEFNTFLPMNDENGNLAVQVDVADTLTFTVSGMEVTA